MVQTHKVEITAMDFSKKNLDRIAWSDSAGAQSSADPVQLTAKDLQELRGAWLPLLVGAPGQALRLI